MVLEIATTIGAVSGALLAAVAPIGLLFVVFGAALLVSALPLGRKIGEELPQGVVSDRWARRLALARTYPHARRGRGVAYARPPPPAGVRPAVPPPPPSP